MDQKQFEHVILSREFDPQSIASKCINIDVHAKAVKTSSSHTLNGSKMEVQCIKKGSFIQYYTRHWVSINFLKSMD